jgi:ParB family chromosome partitioning protein
MKRKDELKALFSQSQPDRPAEEQGGGEAPAQQPRQTASAVRSIGLNLRNLSADAEHARKLREQLDSGTAIVELDPESIEPSFIADRLVEIQDESFDALVASIKANGQLVPILVRAHPKKTDSYQVAYGHRRWRAARILGTKVRAAVRELNDDEMVIAQGKENSERRDLTFIERALFAQNLEDRGFDRPVLMAALSVDRSEIARLLVVARSVPAAVVQAIGPAPKAGRPRWLSLAGKLHEYEKDQTFNDVIASASFKKLTSDQRFEQLFRLLNAPAKKSSSSYRWSDATGRRIVKIDPGATNTKFVFDERLEPNFAEYVAGKLGELHTAFKNDSRETNG